MSAGLGTRVVALVAEAAQWRLIGRLLERPRGDWWTDVAELAASCPDVRLREAGRAVAGVQEGVYLEWLGPGGHVCPRESGHRASSDPGHLLAEIGAFYEAFQYRPRVEEPPDHAGVEAGFVAYLRLKEAHAVAEGDEAAAQLTAEAAASFVAEHVAAMAEPLARALMSSPPHLAAAAAALLKRAGPRPAGLEGGWAPRGLEGACLSCGDFEG